MKNKIVTSNLLILFFVLSLAITTIFTYFINTSNVFGQNVDKSNTSIPVTENKTEVMDTELELDLESIINEAIGRNPEIVAEARRWEAAKNKIKRVKSLDDPMLRLGKVNSPDHPFNFGNKAAKSSPLMSPQTISVSQKFPFPGKLRLRGEVATEMAEMQKEVMEAKILEIIAEVKEAYYSLYLVNKSIEITEENRELLQKFTKIAEAMYSVGKVSQRDVLAAMVELSKTVNNITVLEQSRKTVLARLNNLLNRRPEEPLGTPKDFDKHKMTFKPEELEKMALENRPVLQRSEHAVAKSRLNLDLVKKDYYSDFTAMIEYRHIGDFPSDAWASALSINIPWLWSKQRQKVKEARMELQAANADNEAINNRTLFEIREVVSRVISANSTLDLFKTSVIPLAEQSLDAARIGYETGRADFLTLIDSQRTLLDAKLQYYRALVEYEQNLAKLEKTVGVRLTGKNHVTDK
ncbi:MAG: TolC family protein [Candidatus Anammoxibacter sp.]